MSTENPMGHILVVDDDPFVLKTTCFTLSGLGYEQVLTAESVTRALEMMQSANPPVEVILTDLNMPGTDGVEFLRQLADEGFTGDLLLISGEDTRTLSMAENLARVRHLNVLGTLAKPIKPGVLKQILTTRASATDSTDETQSGEDVEITPKRLSNAIASGELEPWYQLKVDINSREPVGVEVLARWPQPNNEMLFPDSFIPVAEAHGLIDPLTTLMLDKALKQAEAWQEQGLELFLAVNVSMDSLHDLGFPDRVGSLLEASGLKESSMLLEVTESRLMQDLASPLDNLVRLRLKRVRLSIDDFGTGHSNLEQLRDLPFDELKLDRSFVQGAASSETTRAILESSVELAKRLGMTIVAEGVETEQDWERVAALGCDQAQGYFIARPMPAEAIPGTLREWVARSSELQFASHRAPGWSEENEV
ncbi:MAG: EAL domain-containing response regulator [Sedimenticola sp.]